MNEHLRAAPTIQRLPMNEMLFQIAQAMEFQLQQAGAQIDIGELPDCRGDSTQINQVFSNLLDNPVKYLDPLRSGRISVSGAVEGSRVVYSLCDNGIGIARGHQAKAFEILSPPESVAQHRGGGGTYHRPAYPRKTGWEDLGRVLSWPGEHLFCEFAFH